MSNSDRTLLESVLKLPVRRRDKLISQILDRLQEESILDAAVEEADKRWKAYLEGKTKAIPAGDIFPSLRQKGKKKT
jgi:hypothetical protein